MKKEWYVIEQFGVLAWQEIFRSDSFGEARDFYEGEKQQRSIVPLRWLKVKVVSEHR